MTDQPTINARWISFLLVLMHLAVTCIASGVIWLKGDWAEYRWGLTLSLKIIWGVWMVAALATLLTHATIVGWSFRKYVRWAGDQMPAWTRFRPTKAPWSKSGAASFSFTVAMVSVTGAIAVAVVVMWILKD